MKLTSYKYNNKIRYDIHDGDDKNVAFAVVILDAGDGTTWLSNLKVSKEYQGKKLASKLLNRVTKDFPKLYLRVHSHAEGLEDDQLVQMYKRFGFKEIEGKPYYMVKESKMKTFKEYYLVKESFTDNAYIFDLDQCLIETNARVFVKDENDNIIKKLSPAEYNIYKKQPNEKFDFSEFDNPEIIHQTGEPTKYFKVIKNISDAIKQKRSNSFIYILTARGSAVKNSIYKFLKDRGIEVRPVDIYTIGDAQHKSVAELKKDVLQKIRNKHIGNVTFYDDDEKNIELAKQVDGIKTRLVKV